MKIFLKKILIISLTILTLLVAVNYFGDAAKIFDTEYEKKMVEIILSGDYVTNITNYDERIFQKELITNIKDTPDVVILGSSRAMLIGDKYFSTKKVMNSSVSGASIEDLIAIYQIYVECGLVPERIIIGVDPWILNDNNGQNRWKSISSYYDRFHNKEICSSNKTISIQKFKELFSFSYFQSSIKEIPDLFIGQSQPIATKDKKNVTMTKLTDGTIVYDADYRNKSQEEINHAINSYISGNIYSIENFDEISEEKWSEFKILIDSIEKNKIDLCFFLCPYPPLVYKNITNSIKYHNILSVEKIIRELAQEKQIKIYGSFNPFKLGFDETYFYDGMHCNEKGVFEIFERLCQ